MAAANSRPAARVSSEGPAPAKQTGKTVSCRRTADFAVIHVFGTCPVPFMKSAHNACTCPLAFGGLRNRRRRFLLLNASLAGFIVQGAIPVSPPNRRPAC
jgi:hypothetical protein